MDENEKAMLMNSINLMYVRFKLPTSNSYKSKSAGIEMTPALFVMI